MEIANGLGVPFGQLSNWIVRAQFVEPQSSALFRGHGNRRLYRVDQVAAWVGEADPETQARQFLADVGLSPTGPVWQHVRLVESFGVMAHRWPPSAPELYLATLH